ncbi:MAG: helix-hairpin-helix domain-containing protein [Isosphaeraceae bacterium]
MGTDRKRAPWGWSVRTQRLLVVLVLLGALGIVAGSASGRGRPAAVPRLVVNPNDVPRPVLEALPRLGPVLSGRIVAGRKVRRFDSLADLDARVRGIGPVTARAIRPYLRFDHEPDTDEVAPPVSPLASGDRPVAGP